MKPKQDYVLPWAMVIAIALHAAVIFGIHFSTEAEPSTVVQEVTTVLSDNLALNEQAELIANASQQGGGESAQVERFENNTISPLSADKANPTDDIVTEPQVSKQQAYQESYLRTTLSWQKVNDEHDNKPDKDTESFESKEQRLLQQIATLETKISSNRQLLAKKTAVKTINSNSTTTGEAAKYIEHFREQAYRVGNAHYPQAARAYGLTGDVRLMVVLDPKGQVKAIKVLKSSGSPILDNAAKNSVRKAAPFGEFGKDMQDYVELRIIRTWRFGETVRVDSE